MKTPNFPKSDLYAFPMHAPYTDGKETVYWTTPGMTLRDYLAAAALTGMLTDTTRPRFNAQGMAVDAYRYADAMLAAREGK